MKGEYVESKNEAPNMFSKLHHHHQTHPFTQPFHFTPTRDQSQTSEDDNNSRSSVPSTITLHLPNQPTHLNSGDGASVEVVRRQRGRPPGSKNKPRPTVVITRDSEPSMRSFILEVPGGSDVVEAISRFSRCKNMGLCVLSGSGRVANVTLRQPSPSSTPGATVTFHGRFDLLSICATFLPYTASYSVPNDFTISLAGPQGQIIGGIVEGSLVAAGAVFVIAASFNNPSYHRLPEDDEVRNSVSGGEVHSPPVSGGGESGGHAPVESCVMPMYSCHVASDVIWVPAARQSAAPPHQPY